MLGAEQKPKRRQVSMWHSPRQYIPRSSHSEARIGTILNADFHVHLCHHGFFVKSAEQSHCIVNHAVMDGGIFLRDEVIYAKTLRC